MGIEGVKSELRKFFESESESTSCIGRILVESVGKFFLLQGENENVA